MATPIKDVSWLEWMTRLVGQPAFPEVLPQALDPSCFYCLLDEQPTHLVPERLLVRDAATSTADSPLMVNPRCHFSRDGGLPPEAASCTPLMGNFAPEANMVWVSDPATEAWQPFWLGQQFRRLLAGCRPGEPAPPDLPPLARMVLAAAGVLMTPDQAARRRQEWSDAVAQCQPEFQERRYVPVAGLIHPFHVGALRRYYRRLIRKGKVKLGDETSPRRYAVHNEEVARFFHHQLAPVVTAIAGEPVKPSYVYFSSYQNGAKLVKHQDRDQCEFSITFCLDYSPEPARETPWPLRLDTKTGTVTVYQAIGDGLLYRGVELPHYRDTLPQAHTSTSIFFHYVRESFTGSLD